MKKIICALLAVMAIGVCFAGCGEAHDDGICDNCKSPLAVSANDEGTKELCAACWINELKDAASDVLNGGNE